jgi:DNA polymerase III subunit beta
MIATFEQINDMESNEKVVTGTKFTIDTDTMKAIKNVFKGHKNGTHDVLNSIMIEMINNTLINIKYTNSDLFIEKMFFAEIENINEKELLIPIHFFKDIKYIKKNEMFTFEMIDENTLSFTRNNVTKEIEIMNPDNYPSFDFLEEEDYEQVETANGYEYFEYNDLNVLKKAIVSTGKTETRPALQELSIENCNVISTDSHRLYRAKTIFKLNDKFMINPSLVEKAIDLCNKNMFLKMSVSNMRVKIQDDYSTRIYYNRYQGNFPDTSRLIPDQFNYEIDVDKTVELYDFLKTLKNEIIKATLKVNESKIIFESNLRNGGHVQLDMSVRYNSFEERDFTINFSSDYIKSGIEQLDKESLSIKIVGNMRPFILQKQKSDKELALILPVRTY